MTVQLGPLVTASRRHVAAEQERQLVEVVTRVAQANGVGPYRVRVLWLEGRDELRTDVAGVPLATLTGERAHRLDELEAAVLLGRWTGEAWRNYPGEPIPDNVVLGDG